MWQTASQIDSATVATRSRRWGTLRTFAGCAVLLLFAKVFVSILLEYRWYFPADFEQSAFLSGRRFTFVGTYRWAFYAHLVSSPVAILLGTFLILTGGQARVRRWHRFAGRLQMAVVLLLVVPSGVVMAQQAYAGPPATWAFNCLSAATGVSAVLAGYAAATRQFERHRRWATRCFILLASPLLLRVVGGALVVFEGESDLTYQLNAWLSWLVPLTVYEMSPVVRGRMVTWCSPPQEEAQ